MVIYKSLESLPLWGFGPYCVDGVRFLFTGVNSDPWLICGKRAINYYTVEDYFYNEFQDRTRGNGSDNLFGLWLSKNAESVRDFIKEYSRHKVTNI